MLAASLNHVPDDILRVCAKHAFYAAAGVPQLEQIVHGMSEILLYVDDSGSEPDPRVRIIVAAFCVSTEKKWGKFESAWRAVAQDAGFIHFHMTEFAGCRRDSWCRDCKAGKTDAAKHPWREWSNSKRKEVLAELVQIVRKYTDQGFGIAFTKEDIKKYVLDSTSALRTLAPDQFGDEHFTFAATTCGANLHDGERNKPLSRLSSSFSISALKNRS